MFLSVLFFLGNRGSSAADIRVGISYGLYMKIFRPERAAEASKTAGISSHGECVLRKDRARCTAVVVKRHFLHVYG